MCFKINQNADISTNLCQKCMFCEIIHRAVELKVRWSYSLNLTWMSCLFSTLTFYVHLLHFISSKTWKKYVFLDPFLFNCNVILLFFYQSNKRCYWFKQRALREYKAHSHECSRDHLPFHVRVQLLDHYRSRQTTRVTLLFTDYGLQLEKNRSTSSCSIVFVEKWQKTDHSLVYFEENHLISIFYSPQYEKRRQRIHSLISAQLFPQNIKLLTT